jgi:hypothetical protein
MGAAVNPCARRNEKRRAERVTPPRQLAEGDGRGTRREVRQPFLERTLCLERTTGLEQGASRLEPQQAIAGKPLLQVSNHSEGRVVAAFPVVDDDENVARNRLAAIRYAAG